MRFRIGDIVKISKDSSFYGISEKTNPRDVEGRIIELQIGNWIRVAWNNGYKNSYFEIDLRLVRK